jgi:glycosyltransferase involved in cell wall biosynthesis
MLLFLVNVDWFFISHRLPIALAAKANGYEVHIACAFTNKREYLESLGFIVHEIDFSRSGTHVYSELRTMFRIYRLLKLVKPSIVHAVTIKPVLYGGIAAKISGIHAVVSAVSGLGLVFVASGFKAKLRKFLVKLLYKAAFSNKRLAVIFQNPVDRLTLLNAVSLKADQCIMIKGSGVDLNEYKSIPEIDQTPVVVMAARLLREKGVYVYIDAIKEIKRRGISARFLLVGEPDIGNPNTVTRSELDEWRESGIVELLGFREDIADIFSSSNLVVLPSFYGEGLPKVLIEAAACGRAIITTDNPGCAEAVINGVTGLIVSTKNSLELANAIQCLIENPELRRKMGTEARIYAEKEFDVRSVVDKHLAIYKELMP